MQSCMSLTTQHWSHGARRFIHHPRLPLCFLFSLGIHHCTTVMACAFHVWGLPYTVCNASNRTILYVSSVQFQRRKPKGQDIASADLEGRVKSMRRDDLDGRFEMPRRVVNRGGDNMAVVDVAGTDVFSTSVGLLHRAQAGRTTWWLFWLLLSVSFA